MVATSTPPGAFEAHAEVGDGEARLRLAGRLGVRDGEALEEALIHVVVHWPARVTIDLSDLEEVAAIGLGSLNLFRRALARAGGRLSLLDPRPQVARQLRECGLGDAVKHGGREAAG
jgi:anti-anti-sigma factor